MLDLEDSALRRDTVTAARLERLIPGLMDDADIDCWILISREYAEDPVAQTMLPAKWMSSRRRTILVFLRENGIHTREAITRYEIDSLFPGVWDPASVPDQWEALATRVKQVDPHSIAINTSDNFAHADGLTATEHGKLLVALGPDLSQRIAPPARTSRSAGCSLVSPRRGRSWKKLVPMPTLS